VVQANKDGPFSAARPTENGHFPCEWSQTTISSIAWICRVNRLFFLIFQFIISFQACCVFLSPSSMNDGLRRENFIYIEHNGPHLIIRTGGTGLTVPAIV
jgi:hypothetical protein